MFFTQGYLKSFDVRATDNETLAFVLVDLRSIIDGFARVQIDLPQWVAPKAEEVLRELNERKREEKKMRLARLRIRRDQLKPVDEKRKDIDNEIVGLEKELG